VPREEVSGGSNRRWSALVAACVLAGGLLAGCAPAGVDGNLVDDWPAMAEPKIFTPASPACHASAYRVTSSASTYETVDCNKTHGTETIHVGTLRGENGSGNAPPAEDSPAMRAAYGECEQESEDFLGDDWRAGRLWLGVTFPSPEGWTGGARWFRCDLIEVTSKEDDTPITRTASLKDALSGERPLGFSCYQVTSKNDTVTEMKPLDCTASHNAEFVGVYEPPDDAYHAACRNLIAKYVGISSSTAKNAGSVASPFSKEEWERGNRGVRCHVWLEDKKTTKSLKGAGSLPS
jgi:Septum formation